MTDIPSFDTIKLDVADHVATITLNRPERLNSMPPAMADDIRAALDWMGVLGARALLITGEGRGFCSGADLAGDRTASAVGGGANSRSEEHTSELQSLMRISYAVFCLKKKK